MEDAGPRRPPGPGSQATPDGEGLGKGAPRLGGEGAKVQRR